LKEVLFALIRTVAKPGPDGVVAIYS